jgi:hypothetical protein
MNTNLPFKHHVPWNVVFWTLAFLSAPLTRAVVIYLEPVDIATGVDNGPQDGVFDVFSPLNIGSVDNNGYISYRTGFEFDLSAIPRGAKINAANLTLNVGYVEGARSLAVNIYSGDGSVSLADLSSNGLAEATLILQPPGSQSIAFSNLSTIIQNLVSNNCHYAGFNLREEPANTANYTILFFDATGVTAPQLLIDYESNSVPNPDSDNDGVPDAIDQCPNTPAGSVVDANGCSIEQLVPCEGPLSGGTWKTHGEYVSGIAHTANIFVASHLITLAEADRIIKAAARSNCGKKYIIPIFGLSRSETPLAFQQRFS